MTLVELRDIRERIREGFVPGSLHAPRGMLEFRVDPESPYPGRARIVRVRRPSSAQRRL